MAAGMWTGKSSQLGRAAARDPQAQASQVSWTRSGAVPGGVADIPQRAMQLHHMLGAGCLMQAVNVLHAGCGEKLGGCEVRCSACTRRAGPL